MLWLFNNSFLSAAVSNWLPILLDTAMKSVLILVIAIVAIRLMRRATAATRHLICFFALASLPLLPVLSAILPGWQVLPRWIDITSNPLFVSSTEIDSYNATTQKMSENSNEETSTAPSLFPPSNAFSSSAYTEEEFSITDKVPITPPVTTSVVNEPIANNIIAERHVPRAWIWIFAVWGFGAIFIMISVCLGMLSLYRLERTAQPITDDSWLNLTDKISSELGLKQPLVVLRSNQRLMPMTWGIFKPRLLLPEKIFQWPADRLRLVLLHELAHVKRWDYLTQLITRAVCGLYWFNPLVWIASRRMITEGERACDNLVLRSGSKPTDYAEQLLQTISGLQMGGLRTSVAISMAHPSKLEGRLLAILDPKKKRQGLTRTAVVTSLIAVTLIVLLIALMQPIAGEDKSTQTLAFDQNQRLDYYGDPLPNGVVIERGMLRKGAIARLGTHRLRHSAAADSVTFSPDGKTIASGGGGVVILWQADTGKMIHRLMGQTSSPDDVLAFSPDGKMLASGSRSDGLVIIWDPNTGKIMRELHHDRSVHSLAFSPDSKSLAAVSGYGSLRGRLEVQDKINLWDVNSGKIIRAIVEPHVYWARFTYDGKTIVSASKYREDSSIRFWNASTGKELRNLVGTNMHHAALSPDGQTLAIGLEDQAVSLWDMRSDEKTMQMPTIDRGVSHYLTFSPDGNLLVSCGSLGYSNTGLIRIKNLKTGEQVQVPLNYSTVAFSPDSETLASGDYEGRIRFWDPKTGSEIVKAATHSRKVQLLTFSPDGKTIISKAMDGNVCLWDAATGALRRQFQVALPIRGGAFSSDGRLLVSSGKEKSVLIYGTTTGKLLHTLEGYEDSVWRFAFTQNGKTLAMIDGSEVLSLWNVDSAKQIMKFNDPIKRGPIIFSPDGSKLATAGRTGMIILNAESRSPGKNTPIRIWDTATGKELAQLGAGADPVSSLAFSPDGNLLASGHGVEGVLRGTGPSGSAVSATGSDTVRLWHLKSGQQMGFLKGHTGDFRVASGVMAVAFSPDGKTIASGGMDGTIRLWSVFNCIEIARFQGHGWMTKKGMTKNDVHALAFSPDGKYLASGGADGTILVWDLSITQLPD